jgi:uncharacterized SAM-binding protein YcdF (DUF218 family)
VHIGNGAKQVKKMIYFALSAIIIAIAIFAVYAHIQIKRTASQQPPKQAGYLIILGAKVNGTVMSKALRYRAEAALAYLRENPESKVIASGGMGKGEEISEARAMESFLYEHGISKNRILLEEKSTTTSENLLFSEQLYHIDEAIIVSSDFHLYRAIEKAKKLGMKGYPLAAKTPSAVKWKLYIREYAAILRLKLTGK